MLLGWELERCSPPGQLRCVEKGLWRDVVFLNFNFYYKTDKNVFRFNVPYGWNFSSSLLFSSFFLFM